jgi:DNA (cytosine-5)-methyltransferase 1
MSYSPTAISLFSGCGGDTLGLETAGFKVVGFNEFNAAATQSHLQNFPTSTLIKDPNNGTTDITKVPDSSFETYKNKVNIIFAGFPCQGFSKAGAKRATDPRNQLFQQFVRSTKIIQPDFIIGENVVGLTSMKSGPNESDPPMLDVIKKAFYDIGYDMTYHIVEATNFGVPQKRKRILLIGWARDIIDFDPASFWASVFAYGATKPLPILRTFVTNSMEAAYKLPPDSVPDDFADYALPVEQSAEPTGTPHPFIVLKANEKLLSCSKRVSPIHSEIIDLDKPSKTIICTYDHQPRLLVGLRKPDGTAYARCLLPNELKQIQGFPANFQILGKQKEQIVQIGNAVPPPLIEAVAAELHKYY